MAIKDGFNNLDDTRVQFTYHPFVLQNPVRDIISRYRDIRVETMGSPRPLQYLLVELCGLPTIQYQIHLVAWMKRHENLLNFATQWCSARGQDLVDYYDHLGWGGPPDGLEVMLVSLAIDTRINMIFSDTVCTTAAEGIDFYTQQLCGLQRVCFYVASLILRLVLLQMWT